MSVIFALVSCQEAQKSAHDAHAETPVNPLTDGFSFYVTSEEVKLADVFVVVWLTGGNRANESEELAVGRTWPLVSTVLSHEFSAMGMQGEKEEGEEGRRRKRRTRRESS